MWNFIQVILIVCILIFAYMSFVPATFIGIVFSITYRNTCCRRKAIIRSTMCAPIITLVYCLGVFHETAVLADYLFFPTFALCFTPLIAMLRLKTAKSMEGKKLLRKSVAVIVDVLYFVLISTVLGALWLFLFEFNSPFGKLNFMSSIF